MAFTDPPTTTYIVQVESTLKGAGEKLLPIRQVGFFRDSKTIPEAAPHLEKERPYLLFLRKLPQSNAFEIVEGSYYAVEGTKGTLVSNVETLPSWVDIEGLRRRLLQALLEVFVELYNHQRPHNSLPERVTPATAYRLRPKATPGERNHDTHWRVRTDRVDKTGRVTLRHNGRLHHIGLGHEHAGTHIVMLIADLHIRVVDRHTGELLRALTLDLDRDYQPLGRPPGPQPPHTKRPEPKHRFGPSGMS